MPSKPRNAVDLRREEIVRLVRARGSLEVDVLAAEVGIPPATLRRDLRLLESRALIRRSYGVVHAVESSRHETSLAWRAANESEFRRRIADAAVTTIGEASTIYIDEGRTTALVAERLPNARPLTIVTPSLQVAAELSIGTPHEVLLLGGRVRGRTMATVDYWARDMLSGFVIDLAFLGANGVTAAQGLTTPDPAVAAIKSAAVRASRRRVFVGDHTKFGVTSFARFAGIADIELFVTTDRIPAMEARSIGLLGGNLLRV